MRKLMLLVLLVTLTRPAFATDQVSVADLEKIVSGLHRRPDANAARQLAGLELTERLSNPRLKQLESELPGQDSRQSLIALADAAAFLNLPASDVPAVAAPDRVTQEDILDRTRDFIENIIPTLPNFFATQVTLQFSDSPRDPTSERQMRDRRLHAVGSQRATVRYIAGREETELTGKKANSLAAVSQQPVAEGVFALAYGVILKDAFAGTPSWSHWENGAAGLVAVFHYDVPIERSHYNVPVTGEEKLNLDLNAYTGEVAVDPSTGAILRITFEAERPPASSVAVANILIEYGPVEIGGKTYICPVRSAALSLSRQLDIQRDIYKFSVPAQSPFFLRLNDVTYTDFHLFKAEMRMLPAEGYAPVDPASNPAPKPQSTPPAPPKY